MLQSFLLSLTGINAMLLVRLPTTASQPAASCGLAGPGRPSGGLLVCPSIPSCLAALPTAASASYLKPIPAARGSSAEIPHTLRMSCLPKHFTLRCPHRKPFPAGERKLPLPGTGAAAPLFAFGLGAPPTKHALTGPCPKRP